MEGSQSSLCCCFPSQNEEADGEPRYATTKVNPRASFNNKKTKENPNDESFQEKKTPNDEQGAPAIDKEATTYIEKIRKQFEKEREVNSLAGKNDAKDDSTKENPRASLYNKKTEENPNDQSFQEKKDPNDDEKGAPDIDEEANTYIEKIRKQFEKEREVNSLAGKNDAKDDSTKENPKASLYNKKTKENPNDQSFQEKNDPNDDEKGAPDIDEETTTYIEKIRKQFEEESEVNSLAGKNDAKDDSTKENPRASLYNKKTKENPNDQSFQEKKDPNDDEKGAPDIDEEATTYIEKIRKRFEDAQQANVLDEQPGKERI